MKNLYVVLVLIGLMFSACADNWQEPSPNVPIEVSGQILYNCNNPAPLANLRVGIGNGYLYTDSLGNFSGTVLSNGKYSVLYLLGSKNIYSRINLVTNIPTEKTNLGVIYATKPEYVTVVVSYNLSSLDFSKFKPIKLEYSKLGPNPDKLATTPQDILTADTILVDSERSGLIINAISGSNIRIPFLNGGSKHEHGFQIKDFCSVNSTVITFRKQE